ncbi:unnamed protein product [Pedinophyceae sp. YPF-701]|nr:unnamed protein product [Pedinophyceae sp. YPF-701]
MLFASLALRHAGGACNVVNDGTAARQTQTWASVARGCFVAHRHTVGAAEQLRSAQRGTLGWVRAASRDPIDKVPHNIHRGIMPGARFVCVPSDETDLAFKTVRARPRPENAIPEMETMLNVSLEDLEELLTTAFARVEDFLTKECGEAERKHILALTRIEAESSAVSRDIQAVTTLWGREDLQATCRALSVPGRELRRTAFSTGGKSEICATLRDANGDKWGPASCNDILCPVRNAQVEDLEVCARARHACQADRASAKPTLWVGLGARLSHAYGAQLPADLREYEHPALKRIEVDVVLDATWSPAQPRAVEVRHCPMPETCGATSLSAKMVVGERVLADMGDARRAAQMVTSGVRDNGALHDLSVNALVPPTPGGVAAHLNSREQDWDPAGRFPAVSLIVVTALALPRVLEAFLTVPDGMRWRKWTPSDARPKPALGLVAEISDPETFCRPRPAPVPWRLLTDKLAQHRATLRCVDVADEIVRTGLMRCVVNGISDCMVTHGDMALVDAAIRSEIELFFGDRYMLEPRFQVKNVPEDELEEILLTTLRRTSGFVEAASHGPQGHGLVLAVLTRFEAECWARSSELKARSTLCDLEGPSVDAFCRMISTEGRQLRADEASGSDEFSRVYVTLTHDGTTHGPLECSSVVDGERCLAAVAARDAYNAARILGDDDADQLLCFREAIELEVSCGARGDPGPYPCDVIGRLAKQHDHKIIIDLAPRDAESGKRMSEAVAASGDSAVMTSKFLSNVLRRPGALRAVCEGALVHPSDHAAARRAPEQAWDDQGRFPAVSLNVCSLREEGNGRSILWLELPPGMRWRPAAGHRWERGVPTRVTPVVAEVVDANLVRAAERCTKLKTWNMLAENTRKLAAREPAAAMGEASSAGT